MVTTDVDRRTERGVDREWAMYVGGAFEGSSDGATLDVVNPATGEIIATAPSGTADDVDRAVAAAREAFASWRWTSPEDRAGYLFEIADRIEAHHDELVEIETLENGKPRWQSANDVVNAVRDFRYYAGGADKFYSDTVDQTPGLVSKKVFEPYGVAGVVIPWNWPPMHTADFASVALAAGNAVVLKPAPETPLSSLRIAELAADVLPDGVFNVVTGGTEPGVALTSHPDVDVIAFTGHDETGEKVLAAAAEHITPVMLELGGKNPELVFPDADLEKAVSGVLANTFYNSGQACSDTERLLLHEDVVDAFLEAFCPAVESLVVGDGLDEATQMGPAINEVQREKFHRYLDVAREEGGEVVAQADLPDDPALSGGYWVPPSVVDGVEQSFRIANEEVFGPLVSVITFADEAEAVEIANAVDYGLTSTVWTGDVGRAERLAAKLESGVVTVNCPSGGELGLPFGGYKRSGIGRKKDFSESMRAFTQVKAVRMDLTDEHYSL